MAKEDFTFFYKFRSPFSNWFQSTFVHEGQSYNCSEQFMMQQKALLFGDVEIAEKVMKQSRPSEQKLLGRQVKGFNQRQWLNACIDIMVPALVSKFTQDMTCFHAMRESLGTTLVEASPVDAIWGIGLAEDDPRAWNEDTWLGLNLLGVCLGQAREKIDFNLEPDWPAL